MQRQNSIPIPTIKRFPSYLRILEQEEKKGEEYISATVLAKELGYKPIQVRKDISCTGIEGKPKVGFRIKVLRNAINHALGWDNSSEAVIIGAGNMGRALSCYEGFRAYGLSIAGLFDCDVNKIGNTVGQFTIRSMDELEEFIREQHISIAVVTVPGAAAQAVADYLVNCGIKAIWNFAPKDLKVPEGVVLQRTDLGTSFAVLSAKMRTLFDEFVDSEDPV